MTLMTSIRRWSFSAILLVLLMMLAQDFAPHTDAQSAEHTTFDAVSIRPSKPPSYPGASGGPSVTWAIQPDGYRAVNQTIWSTIMIAYFPQGMANWTPDRLKGAPSWLDSEEYDINARVSSSDLMAWQQQGNTLEHQELFRAMLQSMLADRCKLVVHRIPAEIPGLVLVVGKHGAHFKRFPPAA
jgi:uncharacterized protein (TIGR03435 family)